MLLCGLDQRILRHLPPCILETLVLRACHLLRRRLRLLLANTDIERQIAAVFLLQCFLQPAFG